MWWTSFRSKADMGMGMGMGGAITAVAAITMVGTVATTMVGGISEYSWELVTIRTAPMVSAEQGAAPLLCQTPLLRHGAASDSLAAETPDML
jgi:hypothetical protein